MKAKILSLNIGHPAPMEWQGKSITSSMKKDPVPGPIVVHPDHIEGNSFANPVHHGTLDSILYAYGLPSAEIFMKELGGGSYIPGSTGETLTLDELDEKEVSAGDVFRFGEVEAQATFPRIPCGKVNYRMQHERGQKAMQVCGRSGIYFRVLKPGKIRLGDTAELIERAKHRVSIFDIYEKIVSGATFSGAQAEAVRANSAIPEKILARLV